jgi:hypothetical protein
MDLHNKIILIQVDDKSLNEIKNQIEEVTKDQSSSKLVSVTKEYLELLTTYAYRLGHRDARYKAAELSLETEEKLNEIL